MAIRLQVTAYGVLIAEAIFETYDEADRAYAYLTTAKWVTQRPCGGAVLCRADLPRTWDVPVGSLISGDESP